jgi:hypothetical protein
MMANLVRYYDDICTLISQTVLIPNVVCTEDERNVVTAQALIRMHIIAIPTHIMTSRCGEHVSYSWLPFCTPFAPDPRLPRVEMSLHLYCGVPA